MLKKLLTLLLCVVMLSMPASAALVDIAGEAYEEEINLLYSLGIVEGKDAENFMPNDNLTRAEMVTIVLRLLASEGNTPATFTDVPSSHWASLNIGTAAQMGIVNGVSETEFAPEAPVTYPQAVKMIVCALGYEVQAQTMGGYPSGYMTKASQLDVLSGTSDNGEAISRATMAKLVANALEVDILVRTAYGDAYTYEAKEGANLLNTYMGIDIFRGQITANALTNLGGAAARANQFSMGARTIFEGETNASELLGRTVTAYVTEDDDVYTAVAVVPKYADGVKEINASDILADSTLTNIRTEEDKKIVQSEVASTAKWVYNGVVKTDMTPSDLIFDNGTVTLIDEGNEAHTVFVYNFRNMVVDAVRPDVNRITFKNPSEWQASIVLDEKDTSIKISMINTEGEPITLDDISEWDVLSIATNGNVYRIIQSAQYISGQITELSTDNKTVVIDGKTYGVAGNIARNSEIPNLAIGMEAVYTLDFTGKVAAVDSESFKEYQYGYTVSHHVSKGIDAKETLKVFTQDGEMKVFSLAEGFKLNNIPMETLTCDVDTAVWDVDEITNTGKIKEQLIRYKANENDELVFIETSWDIKSNRDSISVDQRVSRFTEEQFYTDGALYGPPVGMYEFKYLLRDKTVVFRVPETYGGKDDAYSLIPPMSIGHQTTYGKLPNLTLYDVDEDGVISAMVTKTRGSGSSRPSVAGVISRIYTALDEDGAAVKKIDVLGEKGEKSFAVTEETVVKLGAYALSDVTKEPEVEFGMMKDVIPVSALNVGDVIWYCEPDMNGVVKVIRTMFRAETPIDGRRNYVNGDTVVPTTEYYPGEIFTSGVVSSVSKYGATVIIPKNVDGTGVNTVIFSYNQVPKVYLYDSNLGTFSEISTMDIGVDDRIVTFRVTLYESFFVIYR